jgi:hypothetical protein
MPMRTVRAGWVAMTPTDPPPPNSSRCPARRARSVGLIPAARTLILICPRPGSGSGTAAHVSTSGGPYPVITTALGMAVPFWQRPGYGRGRQLQRGHGAVFPAPPAATAADHLVQSCGQAGERSSPDPGDSPACPRDPGQVTVSGETIFRGVRPRRCRSGRCARMTFWLANHRNLVAAAHPDGQ